MSLPVWIGGKKCAACGEPLHTDMYAEIGFFPGRDTDPNDMRGVMFVRYECAECGAFGTLEFGARGEHSLIDICRIIIEQTTFMSEGQKMMWKRMKTFGIE